MARNNADDNAQNKANSSFMHAQNLSDSDSQNIAQANAQEMHMPMQNPQAYAQPYYVMPQMYQPQQIPPMQQIPFAQPISQAPYSAFNSTPLPNNEDFRGNGISNQNQQQNQTPILLGTYAPKIDGKGRVALPAKFRSQLGNGFVMARGQERCVYVLPATESNPNSSWYICSKN